MYVTWYVWHGPILFVCMYASNGKLYMCHMCMVYVHVHTRTPARRAPGYPYPGALARARGPAAQTTKA